MPQQKIRPALLCYPQYHAKISATTQYKDQYKLPYELSLVTTAFSYPK